MPIELVSIKGEFTVDAKRVDVVVIVLFARYAAVVVRFSTCRVDIAAFPAIKAVVLIWPDALRLLRTAEDWPAEKANVLTTAQRFDVVGLTVIEAYG
jgi:Holliday junction resolvase-like predicted endonuclease